MSEYKNRDIIEESYIKLNNIIDNWNKSNDENFKG